MSRPPSFVAALRDTVRAVFVDDPPDAAELFKLAKQHRFPEVAELLQKHMPSWRVVDDAGHTLLHWAALGGNVPCINAALAAGVPCDSRGGSAAGGQTPLMWAVAGGRGPAVQALLDARADPQAREVRNGATAMVLAVQQERFDAMPLLAEAGGPALLAAGDRNGCVPAHWAAFAGHLAALTLLESLKADLAAADGRGMSPLHHAVRAYRPEVAAVLVERGVDPMAVTADHRNCIDMAEEQRNPSLLALLLAAMLRRLLAQWPLRRPASPGGPAARDAAEAGALRGVAAQTPLAFGAAAYWAEVWMPGDADGADTAGSADAPRAAGESPSRHGAQIVMDCSSFDLDYAGSLDRLRAGLAKRVADARLVLRRELLACYVVTDVRGAPVALLSRSPEELPANRFPMRARLVSLREVSSNELHKLNASAGVGVSGSMRAAPEVYHRRILTRPPASSRWSAWKEILRVDDRQHPKGGAYMTMAARENEWTQLIINDVGRTFAFFDRQQQQSLQRMLNAYAVMNPEVGYCQGMNMIGALLLLLSDSEEECFGVLACLMDQVGLADFYREGFPLLRQYLGACDDMLAQSAPEMLEHFAKEGVELNMYLQQWFLTFFTDCLPLPLVLTIWDAVLLEGLPMALKVVVTILTSLRDSLLAMRFQDIATAFKTMRRHIDRHGEWKASEAGYLLVQQAAFVEVPPRIQEAEAHRRAAGAAAAAPASAEAQCFA